MIEENHIDSHLDVDEDLGAVKPAIRRMPTELKALVTSTVDRLKNEALRNGRKATAHKQQQREDYAKMILATEGRDVRGYKHHKTDEERKAARRKQKAASKAKRSPAQIEREKEADKLRKRVSNDREREAAQEMLEAAPDYGRF